MINNKISRQVAVLADISAYKNIIIILSDCNTEPIVWRREIKAELWLNVFRKNTPRNTCTRDYTTR